MINWWRCWGYWGGLVWAWATRPAAKPEYVSPAWLRDHVRSGE